MQGREFSCFAGLVIVNDPKGEYFSHNSSLVAEGRSYGFHTRFISILKYRHNVDEDIAKGRWLPHLRGTWIPSCDKQIDCGLAINWLGVRVRMSLGWARIKSPAALRRM
jgi:hypothetical protein